MNLVFGLEKMSQVDICELRKKAYGLAGCKDCPIACIFQSNNLKELSDLEEKYPDELGSDYALKGIPPEAS